MYCKHDSAWRSTDEPRLIAFRKAYEAGGGKILDIARSGSGDQTGQAATENSLIAHLTLYMGLVRLWG